MFIAKTTFRILTIFLLIIIAMIIVFESLTYFRDLEENFVCTSEDIERALAFIQSKVPPPPPEDSETTKSNKSMKKAILAQTTFAPIKPELVDAYWETLNKQIREAVETACLK